MIRSKTLLITIALFHLFSMNTLGQVILKKYEDNWTNVDHLIKKDLPRSALAEVKKIYIRARSEKQDAQVIKALVYMAGLQQETREDNEASAIKEIENEIPGAKEPVSSILNSLLAEMYWNYFQAHRYNLYERTNTANFKKDDIATWTSDDLHKKISGLNLRSINDEKLLQQTKLEPFDALIVKGNTRQLRPTLYDLLAHRALDYFKNDEQDITKPAYAFEINQPEAFAPAPDFIKKKFTTPDSLSLHHKALLIFQALLSFHLSSGNTDALIDADIERIEFIKQYAVIPDKDNLYIKALSRLTKEYENLPTTDQAWYLLAAFYENRGSQYKPIGDSTFRYERKKAKEICEKVLLRKEDTEGKMNCFNLLKQVESKELSFSVEKVNVPGLPFRSLINYRNFNQLYLRIIKPGEKLKSRLENQDNDKYWNSIITAPSLKSWEQSLPVTNDLQLHSIEIKIDPLPAGEYLLIAGTAKDFNDPGTLLGARLFYVSSLSYVNSENNFFILNRNTGDPIANSTVQIWERKYDYQTSKYTKEKLEQYTSDKNGFISVRKIKTGEYNYNFVLEITGNGDHLFINDQSYNYFYRRTFEKPKESINTYLFTDRGIYRPGQTVYFKGIVIEKNSSGEKSAIRAGYETTIYLKNANYETTDSLEIKTNEFGSFSGTFHLPQGLLNGHFNLEMKNNEGRTGFNVEEYKRPKFYVDFEKLKGSYKINDTIRATGLAKAYSGNNIDQATVKYRVVREPRFIYTWLYRNWWLPRAQPMEISHGEIKTNENGEFKISFRAIPDLTIDNKLDPVFDYRIYADVTDINGETRSGETTVSVSFQSLILKVNIPESLLADSLKNLSIRTENMNGLFEPASVNVRIVKLEVEKRLIRNRFWARPDQFAMSKEEYIRYFPNDEYDNESNYESWQRLDKVFEKQDSIKENKLFTLDNKQLTTGYYLVEISTKDRDGQEVKDEKYIELYDENPAGFTKPVYIWSAKGEPAEPGGKAMLRLGSSADNLFVIGETTRPFSEDSSTTNREFFKLNNEKKKFDIPVFETDRGGITVSYLFVKHNRFYHTYYQVDAPRSNKDLQFEYLTFRDKTLPGSQEKWKIKISGYKKEKVAAEVLASMYDASLDQFYPFQWYQPRTSFSTYMGRDWNEAENFMQWQSENRPTAYDGSPKYFNKEYDRLVTDIDETVNMKNGGRKYKRGYYDGRALDGRALGNAIAFNSIAGKDVADTLPVYNLNDPTKVNKYIVSFSQPQVNNKPDLSNPVQPRKNFNETAFFFPDLRTDSSGNIEFSFTMPEALTKWKFQTLAHTKDVAFGLSSKEIITQKELMVQPNTPRFLREGDRMEFSAKIVNLSEKEITGQAQLELFDAATNQPVDGWFQNMFPNQYFTVAAGQSEAVQFPVQVPYLFNKALGWRIIAKAGNQSDGEEASLPVLTNKMLVTESLPLNLRGSGTRDFKFEKLLHTGESETLQNYALTVEYTSNPAWYAVQSLPWLMEFPYECAEQTWNRYYANSLATMIVNYSPRIKQVFERWKTTDTAALLSNLQKDEELKSVLLEETPWVLEAKTESQRKKNIAVLFDMIKMSRELGSNFEKLKQMQGPNGGFTWFRGGPDDRYITQYIVTGIGHLQKLNGVAKNQEGNLNQILTLAIPYLDRKIKEGYDDLIKNKTDLKKYTPGYTDIQYLYMRSFFPGYTLSPASQKAYEYFKTRTIQTWTMQGKYAQGMIALFASRTGDKKTMTSILRSLKETAINNEELGMYWQNQKRGWFWYEAPIETQALLIEAFNEAGDTVTVNDLKTWLLKNKQTNNWSTTKATAEACYALLLQGGNWINSEPAVTVNIGSTSISSAGQEAEAGTGYFKQVIPGERVNAEMGNISVHLGTNSSSQKDAIYNTPGWGSVYWQYFENLDKITPSSTPLKLVKKLFVSKNTDRGPVLYPIQEGDAIKVGDKINVRIELRVDRDMEYVHMKDMRASGLEPVNVLSGYKWQGGLGYYESTKDAGTHFFFGRLDKGTYVFEYSLFATHKGNFSNGVTTIQCMYAPEFSSHSEGIRIYVE